MAKTHIIIQSLGDEMTITDNDDGTTELYVGPFMMDGAYATLTNEQALLAVKALLPKILERGDLDAAIKTWISHNELDGDPFDDCGNAQLTYGPESLYETVYDCIEGIMEK